MSFWQLYFGWPAGGVWPNLVASAITGSLTAAGAAFVVLRKGAAKLEAHHQAHAAELAAHREAVAQQLAEHHQAVLAAVAPKEGT